MKVSGLRKLFPSPTGVPIQVLENVSFSASAGEMVAIIGASGAGKSTLLHLLGGLETADSGEISFTGVNRESDSRPSTSFVFQFHYLLSDFTAVENVALPLMINRVSAADARRQAIQLLSDVGLGERVQHKIGDLSGGEQQRVAVARTLITNPMLVLADEPTGNLDASIAEEIGSLLGSYCRRQRAIVLIATHNPRLAQTCDRILVLERGSVHAQHLP